ncbi:hypothetical protein T484DRAFT_1774641 [Baffinella frigidus]|nr:hypothetical protein T484DRAFT_1774641 [Cryptophyta sp. CCMP2293]
MTDATADEPVIRYHTFTIPRADVLQVPGLKPKEDEPSTAAPGSGSDKTGAKKDARASVSEGQRQLALLKAESEEVERFVSLRHRVEYSKACAGLLAVGEALPEASLLLVGRWGVDGQAPISGGDGDAPASGLNGGDPGGPGVEVPAGNSAVVERRFGREAGVGLGLEGGEEPVQGPAAGGDTSEGAKGKAGKKKKGKKKGGGNKPEEATAAADPIEQPSEASAATVEGKSGVGASAEPGATGDEAGKGGGEEAKDQGEKEAAVGVDASTPCQLSQCFTGKNP